MASEEEDGFSVFGCNVLYISVKSIWFKMLFNSRIYYFCLDNSYINESEALELPAIIVLGLIWEFRFNIISFMKYGELFFINIYLGL